MKKLKNLIQMFLVVSMASLCMFGIVPAEQKATKGYNTPIPSSIMTPDKVETRIGALEFFDAKGKVHNEGCDPPTDGG